MLVWRCTEAVPEWIDTVITFEIIKRADDVCQLLFNHDKWPPLTRLFYQCNYDWAMSPEKLKKYVETGYGLPLPKSAWLGCFSEYGGRLFNSALTKLKPLTAASLSCLRYCDGLTPAYAS